VVAVDIPHHVTQRGNARQFVLSSDAERAVYLGLLREHAGLHALSILGYCLMSNHVHLVVIPRAADALTVVLKQTHGRYAAYWNSSHCSSGHVWQGRYYSCPLGENHLWEALRYAELNPVRAGMVAEAPAWEWSSAAAHCGTRPPDACLEMSEWEKRWGVSEWGEYLRQGVGVEPDSSVHPHGAPAGQRRLCQGTGAFHTAPIGTSKGRTSAATRYRPTTN
jgi:putative transposase